MSLLTKKHIGTLWVRMTEIYGHHWINAHSDKDSHNTWLTGLTGVTTDMLAKGLRECMQHPWPPTLPEFRSMCLGFPKESDAIRAAIHGGRQDSLTAAIQDLIGSWDLDHCTYAQLERRAKAVYPQALCMVTEDVLVPIENKQITKPAQELLNG